MFFNSQRECLSPKDLGAQGVAKDQDTASNRAGIANALNALTPLIKSLESYQNVNKKLSEQGQLPLGGLNSAKNLNACESGLTLLNPIAHDLQDCLEGRPTPALRTTNTSFRP